MSTFAVLILAHTDAPHVRRLVGALHDVPVVLQCDAKTPPGVFADMTRGLPPQVTIGRRVSAAWASWSLVEAELEGLRTALQVTDAGHIVVASGSDYPLLSIAEIDEAIQDLHGRSWLWNQPLPYQPWDHPAIAPDGGLWRFRYRYLTPTGRVLNVPKLKLPVHWPIPRSLPRGVILRAGSQWKIYARHDVETILRVVATRPDLVRFWRSTVVPDESFVPTILASPDITGEEALPICATHPWYFVWESPHPRWLGHDELPALLEARDAPELGPLAALAIGENAVPHRKLFARKFRTSPGCAEVLAALDESRARDPAN